MWQGTTFVDENRLILVRNHETQGAKRERQRERIAAGFIVHV